MSKRVANRNGPGRNRGPRNRAHNRYLTRLVEAADNASSEDALEKIKEMYVSARTSAQKFVPKGATKLLSSLVRQRN